MMQLPILIDPCPIVEAVADIRFQTSLPSQAVAGVVYGSLREEFPKMVTLPAASLPPEVQQMDANLFYQAHYRLEGEGGAVLVGPRGVTIGPRSVPYPGWPKLLTELKSNFARIAAAAFITKVERFGLRYVNFFEGDVLPRLALSFEIAGDLVTGIGTSFRTILTEESCKILLQVATGVSLVNAPAQMGSIIDIDCYVETNDPIPGDLNRAFGEFLDVAHFAEKRLFFRLLKPELLQSLHPVYASS